MKVMRRYCDYDYDNNCIILFDADDSSNNNDPFQSRISWISSGDDKDKKYHAMILNEQKEKEKERRSKHKEEKKPLREYLEIKYEKTKKTKVFIKQQQQLLKSQQLVQKQRIESMAAYQNMSPISNHRNYPNQKRNNKQYARGPPFQYHPHPQSHLSFNGPPRYQLQQNINMNQQKYMNNHMMNASMMQNIQNNSNKFHQTQRYIHNNNNYRPMHPRNIMY